MHLPKPKDAECLQQFLRRHKNLFPVLRSSRQTEPEATNKPTEAPSANKDAKEEPKGNAGLIIGIVAAVVVAAAVVFFVIKKKRG